MAADWAQFESTYKKKAEIIYINVDQADSPEFKNYSRFMPKGIPYTLWLDRKDNILAYRMGEVTSQALTEMSNNALR